MKPPEPDVESLIERIADGRPSHRSGAEAVPRHAESSSLVRNLMVLAGISDFHRAGGAVGSESEAATVEMPSTSPAGTWGSLVKRASLGRGGFGEVFRAWDPGLEREVALKLLRPEIAGTPRHARTLVNEARLLAKVRHPNVVTVYGVERHDGVDGFWMELVDGPSLEATIRQQGPMDAEEAARIGRVLCGALATLHSVGLVHRDVKAANVVRERGGRIVLMDFGASGPEAGDGSRSMAGTLVYMDPQVLRQGAPTRRSDIYSLGVLLFRIVSDGYPVHGASAEELRRAHDAGRRRLLRDARPDLPSWFCQAVDRALDPDPQRRFGSVGEFERALSPHPAPRRAPPLALGVAALAVIAVAALWAVHRVRPTDAPLVASAALMTLRHGAETSLSEGDSVAVGDYLWMELETREPAYVYVLNRDATGETYLLFPLSGYDRQNPVPALERMELPGRFAGKRKGWRVGSAGGREQFVVVASATPLTSFEASLQAIPQAGERTAGNAVPLVADQIAELVRGVSETTDLPDDVGGLDPFELARDLAARSGTWVQHFVLENPAHDRQ